MDHRIFKLGERARPFIQTNEGSRTMKLRYIPLAFLMSMILRTAVYAYDVHDKYQDIEFIKQTDVVVRLAGGG